MSGSWIIRVVSSAPVGPVLCAVDLSEPSRRALLHAAALAAAFQSTLAVLRVAHAAEGQVGERAAAAHELDEFVRATLPSGTAGAGRPDILLRPGEPALAIIHARSGETADSDLAAARLNESYIAADAFQLAEVCAARGEADKAFEWLNKALEERDPGLTHAKASVHLRSLYDDPRWEDLTNKIGL